MQNRSILIVGLGNPDAKYKGSPHNAGFAVIDALEQELEKEHIYRKEEKLATVWRGTLEDVPVILAKPKTFMNRSGEAVKFLTTHYPLPITHSLWLVHDDIDLPLGALRIAQNRGAAGHKGVASVIQTLRTKNFVRFRVGIRPPHMPEKRPQALMNKFVIGRYTSVEHDLYIQALSRCVEAVRYSLQNGVEKATTLYNVTHRS